MSFKPSNFTRATTRTEEELLLCCARTVIERQGAERIQTLLRETIDWEYLIHTALQHGILPLLHRNLVQVYPRAIPAAVMDQLSAYFETNAWRVRLLTTELLDILELLKTNGIEVVPFKGPSLAALAYGELELRQSGDLDIVVLKRDVPRIENLLLSRGYKQQLKLEWERSYIRPDCRTTIDLHWSFAPRRFPFAPDPERLFKHLRTISVAGRPALSFYPEALLLILCVHGTKHCWNRLGWICDIAELINAQPGTNWGHLMQQADELRGQRMLSLGLFLAADLLGTALPDEIARKILKDAQVRSLAAHVREWLFSEAENPPGRIERHFFFLHLSEGLRDRLHYCGEVARSCAEAAIWSLGSFRRRWA